MKTRTWPPIIKETSLDQPLPYPQNDSQGILSLVKGRQLFFDDYLIEDTNLNREVHKPKVLPDPILKPTTVLELNEGFTPCATPFNDGIFYDDEANKFKMWYQAGWFKGVGYAESEDGINWKRLTELFPDRTSESVIPIREGVLRDGSAVWLDYNSDPSERYKMLIFYRYFDESVNYYHEKPAHAHDVPGSIPPPEKALMYRSADGINWEEVQELGECGDNTSFFFNPFLNKWVFSVRTFSKLDSRVRTRGYYESKNFFPDKKITLDDTLFWSRTDIFDSPDPDLGYYTQLYALNATPYESVMLGIFNVFMGPPNSITAITHKPKMTDLKIGFSRDGFHWHRTSYDNFIEASRKEGTWNYGYLHAVNGGCLVVGEEIYFYFTAFSGQSPKFGTHKYAGGTLGLAKLRRDGFVSMGTESKGFLTTKLFSLEGNNLFVNTDSQNGSLRAELYDEDGSIIEGFSMEECDVINKDSTIVEITWRNKDVAKLKGRPIAIKFEITNGQIYSFWISQNKEGKSGGYVAASGPGFKKGRDVDFD